MSSDFHIFGNIYKKNFMEFDCNKVIERIKSACAIRGITPNIAFANSGVGKNFIFHLSNQHIPSADKILKLAYFLGVTTDYLLGLSDCDCGCKCGRQSIAPTDIS